MKGTLVLKAEGQETGRFTGQFGLGQRVQARDLHPAGQ
jgi:hypothetical protein